MSLTVIKQKCWALSLAVMLIMSLGVTFSRANETVTLQLKWKHQFQFAGYYAAIEKGYYLEEGLDVILIEGKPGGKEVEEVLSGRANFGIGMSDILLSKFQGKSVVLLANIFQHSPVTLLTIRKYGYNSPQDLFDKKISLVRGAKSAELQAMFLNEGVTFADLTISDPRWNLDDLISGEVDAVSAYISSQPYILKEQSIPFTLISPVTYGIDFYGDNLFTSEHEIAEYPERVEAFRRASLRGWTYALENTEEIVELILTEYAGSNTELTREFLQNEAAVYHDLILPHYVNLGHTNPGRWKHIADTYVRLGMAESDYSLEGFFFQPEIKAFSWDHWAIRLFLAIIILGLGSTLLLSIFNRRLKREILDHQRTGKELREREEMFRALFEQSGGYCMILDPHTSNGIPNIIDANEAACEMHGYTHEEFIGRPVSDIDDENGKRLVKKRATEIMTGKPFYVENEHLRKDGTSFSVAVNAKRIDLLGKPSIILTTEYDITERKRTEEKLEDAERRSRTWLEFSPICTKIVSPDLSLQYMSSAGIKNLKIKDITEYYGKPYPFHFYPEEFKAKTRKNLIKARESGEVILQEEAVTDLDGKQLWYHSTIIPVKNKKGKIDYLLVVSVDTTERKLSEKQLRDFSLNLNEAVRAGRIGLWNWDLKTNDVTYSTEWKRQIGYEEHELKNDYSEWENRVHPEDLDRTMAIVESSIKEINQAHRTEFRLRHKDGSYRWILAQASFTIDEEGQPTSMLGSHLDITEQKNLESELLQAQKMESIGTLAGGIAHDFNNILSSVIGFTELALDAVEKETPIEEDLQEVYTAGLRAKELVQQILSFARQSDEKLKPTQVGYIITEVLRFIRSSIPSTIEIKHMIKSSSFIMASPSQLHRILLNLCTNASQAMENEGGTLEIMLNDISVARGTDIGSLSVKPGDYVEMKISDTGCGIEPHVIEKIYEPYFSTKEPGGGTGLGLAVVHGLVETYGGKILVESTLGKGTVFSVYLPIVKESEALQQGSIAELLTGQERILFVDDEVQIARMASRMLDQLGYSVTTRTSSLEALELFRSKPNDFDLVISDVTMPKLTGDQLSKELVTIRPDIPVILCTGYSERLLEKNASEIGVKAFAYKPIVKTELAKIVRNVLDVA